MKSSTPYLIFDFAADITNQSSVKRLAFTSPEKIIVAKNLMEVRPALKEIWNATQNGFYAAGFISYEAAAAFDEALVTHTLTDFPLLWFGLFSEPVDKVAISQEAFVTEEWQLSISREDYYKNITAIRAAIERGDTYQVNYTLRFLNNFYGDPLAWYTYLQHQSHGAFNAYLDIGDKQILSLSPELFFSWDGKTLSTRPMKGTAKRVELNSESAQSLLEEDRLLGNSLITSEKNRAENVMIVDLLRNDLSRIAVNGSVKVPHLFSLEAYPTLYQLTSTITATTHPDVDLEDIFEALFPCGSITGAPKIKTTEIITELESTSRGIYCGAIGYIKPSGEATFNVPIRTVVIDQETHKAECGVGGGIVWDSVAADEYNEILTKTSFLNKKSQQFKLLETLLLKDGQYAFIERHIDRLDASARHFKFLSSREKVQESLRQYASQHSKGIYRIRLLLSEDGKIQIENSLLETAPDNWLQPSNQYAALMVAMANEPINKNYHLLSHKTSERTFYERHKNKYPMVFDVLLWNEKEELTEFTRGNVVLELNGQLLTPLLKCGLLPGTLRAELLHKKIIEEAIIHRKYIDDATRIWFINGVRGWVQVKFN